MVHIDYNFIQNNKANRIKKNCLGMMEKLTGGMIMLSRKIVTAVFIVMFLLLSLAANGCRSNESVDRTLSEEPLTVEPDENLEVAVSIEFAPYQPEPVTIVPAIEQPPVLPDLSNVQVAMTLSPAQRERLAAAGFVVSPGRQEK